MKSKVMERNRRKASSSVIAQKIEKLLLFQMKQLTMLLGQKNFGKGHRSTCNPGYVHDTFAG